MGEEGISPNAGSSFPVLAPEKACWAGRTGKQPPPHSFPARNENSFKGCLSVVVIVVIVIIRSIVIYWFFFFFFSHVIPTSKMTTLCLELRLFPELTCSQQQNFQPRHHWHVGPDHSLWWGRPGYCRMLSSTPRLDPLDAVVPLSCDNWKMSQEITHCPLGANSLPWSSSAFENHCTAGK